jgi:hypothetical protein
MNRRRIRTPSHVEGIADDLLVVPAVRKLGLAGRTGAVPVSAAAAGFAVENVPGAFSGYVERVIRWAVPGI